MIPARFAGELMKRFVAGVGPDCVKMGSTLLAGRASEDAGGIARLDAAGSICDA
jgi:hypothetical protein